MKKKREEIVLKQVLENIPYYVFWKDRDSNYLGANELVAEIAGFEKASDMVGKNDYDCCWKKEEADYFRKIDKEVMDKGEKVLNIEEPQLQADGTIHTLLTSKVPLFDSNGEVNGILGIFTDITERKKLESEKEKAIQELTTAMDRLVSQEKLASLGTLSAGIAHEIRNPLNLIQNSSEMIKETVESHLTTLVKRIKANVDIETSAELEEELEVIVSMVNVLSESSKRLGGVVDSMMRQSYSDDTSMVKTDLNLLIKEQINFCYQTMRIEFPINCLPEIKLEEINLIDISVQNIARVFTNLITNSFYALSEKVNEIKDFVPALRVTSKKDSENITIYIWDNGPGIPEENIVKIFEPFFTTKPAGVGTGLGLSMINDIVVQQHRGEFTVNSKFGEFTEFKIVLPLES
ncbi:MAG: PAS domain S-box-containing protein [Bacteriovoracaceae bacterium]|jgi:PAS domain S-box-containing protein